MSNFDLRDLPNLYFNEVNILSKFEKSNYIQELISSFHDYDNLFFVSKLYEGTAFNYLHNKWNENQIQFFSACLIQSLLYLRKNHYIHRDIHFGNLALDKEKYFALIDFHIAIDYKYKNNPKNDFVGTPPLCAPEMINHLIYDYNSDYYRLGGMLYFIIFGTFPNILRKNKNLTEIQINLNENNNYSFSCIDFINKLIIADYKKRIGFHDIDELKNHEFFNNFNWNSFINKRIKSPFSHMTPKNPKKCENIYNFTKREFLSNNILKNETLRNIFINYDRINDEIAKIIFNSLNAN